MYVDTVITNVMHIRVILPVPTYLHTYVRTYIYDDESTSGDGSWLLLLLRHGYHR